MTFLKIILGLFLVFFFPEFTYLRTRFEFFSAVKFYIAVDTLPT